MSQWTKRILRRKDGKGTITYGTEEGDVKAPKLMEFIPVTDSKITKACLTIRFMHNVPDKDGGTVYWLEGKVERRITKLSRAKKFKNVENYFRVGELNILS